MVLLSFFPQFSFKSVICSNLSYFAKHLDFVISACSNPNSVCTWVYNHRIIGLFGLEEMFKGLPWFKWRILFLAMLKIMGSTLAHSSSLTRFLCVWYIPSSTSAILRHLQTRWGWTQSHYLLSLMNILNCSSASMALELLQLYLVLCVYIHLGFHFTSQCSVFCCKCLLFYCGLFLKQSQDSQISPGLCPHHHRFIQSSWHLTSAFIFSVLFNSFFPVLFVWKHHGTQRALLQWLSWILYD